MTILRQSTTVAPPGAGQFAPVDGAHGEASAERGVVAALATVPAPGTPPGTCLPGLAAAGADHDGNRIIRVTRLAHAVPGKPDGEVDTRPLRPVWQKAARG